MTFVELLVLPPFGPGLLTLRAVMVMEGGVGTGDGDGDFFDKSTGCASAISTWSSKRRGDGAFMGLVDGPGGEITDDVECGDWKKRCTFNWWSIEGDEMERLLGVGVLR